MSIPDRSQLLQRIASAATLAEQVELIGQLDELDRTAQRQAAQEREVDLARASVEEAFTPVMSRTARGTTESDWLAGVDAEELDRTAMVAQAAAWFGQVPDAVRRDAEEFTEQAQGQARKLASGMGPDAAAAEEIFVDYTRFLRAQSASGIDQIQQTTAPDGVTSRPTPLPPDVFDNFAPPVNDLNAPVVGTETSDRSSGLQEAVSGGGNSSPEQPGGHSETGWMTGPAPEPSLQGGGGNSSPEQPGGHSETGAVPATGGPGTLPSSGGGGGCGCTDCTPGAPCSCSCSGGSGACPCGCAAQPVGEDARKQAASGLPQIQQTTDVHDAPAPTALPTEVAFPWTVGEDDGTEPEGMTGDARYDQGGEPPARHQPTAAVRKRADQWSQPHQFAQPGIANSPATTPPRNVGEAGSGAADAANPEAKPSFGDAHAAPEYTKEYTEAEPPQPPRDVPVSIGGDNGQSLKHPAFASRRIASRQEMRHPDFQRGYKYAARWKPGTAVVRQGPPELEAGIYAAFTDRPEHRQAWLDAHAKLAESEPSLRKRIANHRRFTHAVAAREALPTDGTYLAVQAATGLDLDTTNPTTSPSPTGDTPINGPGRPGPLAGGMDPAAPGGAAPYNGAEPLGEPVVPPTPTVPQGTPVHNPHTGMATSAPAGMGLSPTAAAFRRRVQAGLLAERKEA